MWNARLDEAQAGIKIARYANDTTLMAEEWRRTKEPLDESEREEWKSWLKTQHSENKDHGILSHHFMAYRWGNNGNSERLLFSWAPKSLQMVTAAMKLKDACSLEANELKHLSWVLFIFSILPLQCVSDISPPGLQMAATALHISSS